MAGMLDVERHRTHAGVATGNNQVHQVLERLQRVATAADEQAEVIATDVDDGTNHSEAVTGRQRLADGELAVDIENAQEIIHNVCGEVDVFRIDVSNDVGLFFARSSLRAGRGWATFRSEERRVGKEC